MTTLVSCFFGNANKVNRDYIALATCLLQANIPKIIFVDEETCEKIKKYENENTRIVVKKREDIYLYEYSYGLLENFKINTSKPIKDTLDYMFVICNKTEIVKEAIELNYFNTHEFVWVDFGIKHVFKCSDEDFIKKIENIENKKYDKLRIASIWNPEIVYSQDICKDVLWYFAGGVFGGNSESLIEFAEKTRQKCLQLIREKKIITWEVNVWYMVYLENRKLFNFYECDHNNTIIDNY